MNEQGIPCLMVYGISVIRLSDYEKYKDKWDSVNHCMIAPDKVWLRLEEETAKSREKVYAAIDSLYEPKDKPK